MVYTQCSVVDFTINSRKSIIFTSASTS